MASAVDRTASIQQHGYDEAVANVDRVQERAAGGVGDKPSVAAVEARGDCGAVANRDAVEKRLVDCSVAAFVLRNVCGGNSLEGRMKRVTVCANDSLLLEFAARALHRDARASSGTCAPTERRRRRAL